MTRNGRSTTIVQALPQLAFEAIEGLGEIVFRETRGGALGQNRIQHNSAIDPQLGHSTAEQYQLGYPGRKLCAPPPLQRVTTERATSSFDVNDCYGNSWCVILDVVFYCARNEPTRYPVNLLNVYPAPC